jgi:GntR family transcriptional regulator
MTIVRVMLNRVTPSSPEPGLSRYAALAQVLRERVITGAWPPGQSLPAESQLAAEHAVALGTMRRALELLAAQGYIERVHGKGTFVRQGLAGATMLRFFRFGADGSEVPSSRILSRKIAPLPAAEAALLGLAPRTDALHLLRLRLLGGQPRLLEDLWLPLDLFAPLADDDLALWDDLLYPMYARRLQVHVHHARDDIAFGQLNAAQAGRLGLPKGHPCALVQRAAFDLKGRCVEARTTRGDALAFRYTVHIT